jgi:hypothetical protein
MKIKELDFKEDKGSSMASRVIRNYAREIGADSMDYGMFMKSADLLDKDMLKSLALHIEKSDTAPREYVMKKIADHNPEIFKKMYGDQEGYLSIMKPQKDLTDDESVKEDAPFGSGMELLRMAIMRKFITVQEWDLLKHKWKDAAAEVEEKYSDWPEGEGFGSSDHNFAIRDLMTAVGYEFDDKDTSGSFVVTKQPEEIEKAGIKNARMKGQPVAQESEPSADAERADAARGMWASSKEIQSKFKTWQDFMNSEDFDEWLDDKFREDEGEKFTFGQIAKAKAYAKTYANDMTSAVKNIEAIAKGLSNHPEVADTLKRANENQELDRITKLSGLGEGADFYGYYKDPKDPEGKTMTYPQGMEFKTPHRSNAGARNLLGRLGLEQDFEYSGSHPIDDFIAATDKYLRMNVSDKDSREYDEVEMYHIEANRFKKEHPEITHVGFN